MDPPVEHSVQRLDNDTWLIGGMVVRPETYASRSRDIIALWRNEDDQPFCLQVADEALLQHGRTVPAQTAEYYAGESAALWKFAGVVWKVKAWTPSMQSEAETITYVKKEYPHLPVPEVIHTWTERLAQRSFLVMKQIAGTTLETAWPLLTTNERKSIASQIAEICVDLAKLKRERLETVDGCGSTDSWIQPWDDSKPPWQPRVFGPLPMSEAMGYFSPLIVEEFVFMHGDLAAANFFVSQDDKKITGLIDWEFAGFYPAWWINFKARIGGMALPEDTDSDPFAWQSLLQSELEQRNIVIDMEAWEKWNGRRTGAGAS